MNLKRKSHPGSPDESSSVPTLLFYYLEENDFTNFLQMMAKCIELVCFVPLHRPSHFRLLINVFTGISTCEAILTDCCTVALRAWEDMI